MENLYDRIEYLCRQKGIRPGKLCADLGISRSLMTDLKMGRKKSIRTETAQRIATYLGVSVDRLICPDEQDHISIEDVDVAFYGQYRELNDEDKQTVRDMVRIMRQRRSQQRE